MAKNKKDRNSTYCCRFHEGQAFAEVFGPRGCSNGCRVVGTVLEVETRLEPIRAIADGLSESLVGEGDTDNVFPGMSLLAAAETLRTSRTD